MSDHVDIRDQVDTLDHADILIFSPHPDDAEIGCAGSIILAVQQGLRVVIADLTEGEMASRGTPESRSVERREATALLGVGRRISLHLPDTRVGEDDSHRLALIDVIRATKPRLVLAPYGEDKHPDHAATGRLVREASFLSGIEKLGRGKIHRPERLIHYMIHQPFTPSFVVDISSVWSRKIEALTAYRSQFDNDCSGVQTVLSRPEFMEFVEVRARWFGAMIGARYGEAFFSSTPVALEGLPSLKAGNADTGSLPPYNPFI